MLSILKKEPFCLSTDYIQKGYVLFTYDDGCIIVVSKKTPFGNVWLGLKNTSSLFQVEFDYLDNLRED